MGEGDLVIVATFLNKIEAELAQGALAAADIDAMVAADDAGGIRPSLWLGGVKLLVRSSDAERAATILRRSAGQGRLHLVE
jgi:hypothetical protein